MIPLSYTKREISEKPLAWRLRLSAFWLQLHFQSRSSPTTFALLLGPPLSLQSPLCAAIGPCQFHAFYTCALPAAPSTSSLPVQILAHFHGLTTPVNSFLTCLVILLSSSLKFSSMIPRTVSGRCSYGGGGDGG